MRTFRSSHTEIETQTDHNTGVYSKRMETFQPIPSLAEINQLPPDQSLPMPKIFIGRTAHSSPGNGVLTRVSMIVSCCDNRVDPWDILGLEKWGIAPKSRRNPWTLIQADAVVTRGAAGRMASQFSNLLFLDHVLNFTDIMIMHHTGRPLSLLCRVSANGIYCRLLSTTLRQRRRLSSTQRARP